MELSGEDALNYRRGRSGRPLQRMKAQLKREGTNLCHLCAQPIDLDLPVNHEYAWTLDHAIPLSIAPWLALDMSNAREAHRKCNSSKGNRVIRKSRTSRNW